MRKLALLTAICASMMLATLASAQQADFSFGVGTIVSPGDYTVNSNSFTVPEKGGAYPSVGFDVIFHKRFGFAAEASWKATQGAYGGSGGQPFRPIIYDINGVFQPKFGKKLGADLMAGIGGQSTRFYLPFCTGTFSCTNYTSNNHFLVHIGGGVRYYVWHHFFVRPELNYYRVFNNTNEFSSDNLLRAGASIGYTLGPE